MSREPRHSCLRAVAIEALLLFDAVDHGHGDAESVDLSGHSRLRAACEALVACDPSVWPAVQGAAELIGEELAPAEAIGASVTAGVTGLFRWDGQYYAINDGSGPNVTEVDVGDLGRPKRYTVAP